MAIIYLKIALAAALTILALGGVGRVNSLIIRRGFDAVAPVIVGGAIRISLFLLIFIILDRQVPSDVPAYYYPQAQSALNGGIWNLDFASSYSPLFSYFGAMLLCIWNDPRVFVLFALAVDSVGIWFWHSLLRATIPREDALDISICYALSAPVIVSALVGQQQVWVGTGLAASMWLLFVKHDTIKSAIVQGVTLCVTKILAVLFWPVLFAVTPRRWQWLVAAIAIPLLTIVFFSWLGSDVSLGLRSEQQDYTSGNLIYYVAYLVGGGKEYFQFYDGITALCLLGASLFIVLRLWGNKNVDISIILSAVSLLLVTLLLLSKKSYAHYLSLAYFAVLFVLYKNLSRFGYWCAFASLSIAATLSPTIWFVNNGNNRSLRDWVHELGWSAALPTIVVDWTLIVLYAVTACICLKVMAGHRMGPKQLSLRNNRTSVRKAANG